MSVLLSEIIVGQNQAYVENNEDTVIGEKLLTHEEIKLSITATPQKYQIKKAIPSSSWVNFN